MTMVIVDGSYLARSRYQASEGLGTHALVLQRLSDLRRQDPDGEIVVVWDGPDSAAPRQAIAATIDETYKANRPPRPEVYVRQVRKLQKVLSLLGIRQAAASGGEGDDAIATITARGRWRIWSGDKDLLQLVSPSVQMVRETPSGERLWTHETFPDIPIKSARGETFDSPAEWLTYQAICGDPSDGWIGMRGMGHMTAMAAIQWWRDTACLAQAIVDGHVADAPDLPRVIRQLIDRRHELAVSLQIVRLYHCRLQWITPDPDPLAANMWLELHGATYAWR